MPYIAVNPQKFIGTSVGNGQCVAFARAAALIGHTSTWVRGELVKGATLAIGTAIATFDESGKYENDTNGKRYSLFTNGYWPSNQPNPVNDGRNYCVIE